MRDAHRVCAVVSMMLGDRFFEFVCAHGLLMHLDDAEAATEIGEPGCGRLRQRVIHDGLGDHQATGPF